MQGERTWGKQQAIDTKEKPVRSCVLVKRSSPIHQVVVRIASDGLEKSRSRRAHRASKIKEVVLFLIDVA